LSSLPKDRFDCFICTQTFNFIYDVRSAVSGAYQLLRPGGVLLGTVAGITQVSGYDMARWGDYWRFTPLSIRRLLGESFSSELSIESFGNALSAQLLLQGVAIEDLPHKHLLENVDEVYPVVIGFMAVKTP
jgi:hypothetical protein